MSDARRTELKAFLRTKRARIEPESVGLPHVQRRRRTAGLRIEEAASLAGVSLTWYSAFERGTDIRVSADVLARIAAVLRLTPEELAYLRDLAAPSPARDDRREGADAALEQRIVDAFTGGAAFISDAFWNVFAFNTVAGAVYAFGAATEANLLVRMYEDLTLKDLHVDWDRVVTQMTDIFHEAYGLYVEQARAEALLDRLRGRPEFDSRWEAYGVRSFAPTRAELRHPRYGRLALSYSSFVASPATAAHRRLLIVQTAIDEATAGTIAAIAARAS